MTSTCMVCLGDFDDESMIEDINGTRYCLLDSGDICAVCGIYGLECECKEESDDVETISWSSSNPTGEVA